MVTQEKAPPGFKGARHTQEIKMCVVLFMIEQGDSGEWKGLWINVYSYRLILIGSPKFDIKQVYIYHVKIHTKKPVC